MVSRSADRAGRERRLVGKAVGKHVMRRSVVLWLAACVATAWLAGCEGGATNQSTGPQIDIDQKIADLGSKKAEVRKKAAEELAGVSSAEDVAKALAAVTAAHNKEKNKAVKVHIGGQMLRLERKQQAYGVPPR